MQETLVSCWEALTTVEFTIPAGVIFPDDFSNHPYEIIVYTGAAPTYHAPFHIPPYNVGGCL